MCRLGSTVCVMHIYVFLKSLRSDTVAVWIVIGFGLVLCMVLLHGGKGLESITQQLYTLDKLLNCFLKRFVTHSGVCFTKVSSMTQNASQTPELPGPIIFQDLAKKPPQTMSAMGHTVFIPSFMELRVASLWSLSPPTPPSCLIGPITLGWDLMAGQGYPVSLLDQWGIEVGCSLT